MPNPPLLPQAPVRFVRADVSIGECVRILRDNSLGALLVVSDDVHEDPVGIFTERDLVKNIELVQRGGFWDAPVRTLMSANLRTVTVAELDQAPKLMARYNIRHLPIVTEVHGRKRVIAVLSMRDIFRIVMENLNFDLGKVFRGELRAQGAASPSQKLIGVFSGDSSLTEVVEKGARLTKELLVHSDFSVASLDNLDKLFQKFSVLFLDLDGLTAVNLSKVVAEAKAHGRKEKLFLAFSPVRFSDEQKKTLQQLGEGGHATLLSKPIAVGLLYERFLRNV